jgi:replication initiation and membrane attachment protein DnaB
MQLRKTTPVGSLVEAFPAVEVALDEFGVDMDDEDLERTLGELVEKYGLDPEEVLAVLLATIENEEMDPISMDD